MARIAAGVRSSVNDAVKAYAVELTTQLNQSVTPFRSGQARANWQVAIGTPNEVFIKLVDAIDSKIYDAADVDDALQHALTTISGRQNGQVIWIFNNAPYIQRLNEGYSGQAPAGFVEQAILDAGEKLKDLQIIG